MAAMSASAAAGVRGLSVSNLSFSRGGLNGSSVVASPAKSGRRHCFNGARVVCCRAERAESSDGEGPVATRRMAMAFLVSAAAVSTQAKPAEAAYGESANVFGSAKAQTGFTPYAGNGFKVDVPTKWNPSKEVEFPGQVIRFEDNFDVISNLSVCVLKSDKSSITDFGSPLKFLSAVSYLLGKQSYTGKTFSEGGFVKDEVAQANVLDSDVKLLNGKTYYTVSVLTRTADGDEGGKHQLIVATVDSGKLYLFKAQAGDKRWFKGSKKFVEGAANSFNVV